jgi:uncharacterized protein YbbC (DUF1343 family)
MRCLNGLDLLAPETLPGRDVGLLSHYAAVDRDLRSSVEIIASMDGVRLRAVFGPQHGFFGETQDNMIEWRGYTHPLHGIPVYSLYGATREPTPDMLDGLDCLVVDLQDVGSRYYTYIYTMALCMRRCAEAGIPVLVLDRPNPLGFTLVEGRSLEAGFESFVGMYPIPVRHGLTIAELARLFAKLDCIPSPAVVPLEGWDGRGFPDGMDWVYPSPNMPTPETALVYPGMCLLEATNLSEGRGTTRPFLVFGAPWLDGRLLAEEMNGSVWMEGALLRPHEFIPTFGKHCGETCHGAEIHVRDPMGYRPLRAAVGILMHCFRYSRTRWNPPPYEYEREKMPVDILAGGLWLRSGIADGDSKRLLEMSRGDPRAHAGLAGEAMLYGRGLKA